MGACCSKKKTAKIDLNEEKPLVESSRDQPEPQNEPETFRDQKPDTVQTIFNELQQQASAFDRDSPEVNQGTGKEKQMADTMNIKPLHTEPAMSISDKPMFTRKASLELNEILIQTSMEKGETSLRNIDGPKEQMPIQLNKLSDFFESRRFLTVTGDNPGFSPNPLEKVVQIPTLQYKNKITIIETVHRTEIYEKWFCLYEFEASNQLTPIFLSVYREDQFGLRQELFTKLKEHHFLNVALVYDFFLTKSRDLQWRESTVETLIGEYARSDLRQIIEKRKTLKIPYSETEALGFLEIALNGLKELKKKGIAHLGITTESFIYSEEYKISGLGESLLLDPKNGQAQKLLLLEKDPAKNRFMSPELKDLMLEKSERKPIKDSFKCDIYSLGVVMLDMLRLEKTPIEYLEADYLENVLNSLNKRHKVTVFLLHFMLISDPDDRWDVEKLLAEFQGNEKSTIDEYKFLNKPKKFTNLKKSLATNDQIFQKGYLNREETFFKIQDFYLKGLVFYSLEQYHLAIEQIGTCLRFERFQQVTPEDTIFSIFLHLGKALLHQDLIQEAQYYFKQAERWFLFQKLQHQPIGALKKIDIEESITNEKTAGLFERGSSLMERNSSLMERKSILAVSSVMFGNKAGGRDNDDIKESLNEEAEAFKIICLLYYSALTYFRLSDFENCKAKLDEVWAFLNLKSGVEPEFLCDYFKLCGMAYSLGGKYAISAKCFSVYREKTQNLADALANQGKLELQSGNYLEAYNYFSELLILLDLKENSNNPDNISFLETFGYLMQIAELLQDKCGFFYCLDRTQSLLHEISQNFNNNPWKIAFILDWILRFGVYLQFLDDELCYFVHSILVSVKNFLADYPQRTFLIYAYYCLAKAYYYTASPNDAQETFELAYNAIKESMGNRNAFQNNVILYCAIDTYLWLSMLTKKKEYFEELDEILEDLMAVGRALNKDFLLYYRIKRLEFLSNQESIDLESFSTSLDDLESVIFPPENTSEHNSRIFNFYRSLSLLYEQKILARLRQDKPQEAKTVVEELLVRWLEFDKKSGNKNRVNVLIDDYSELRQVPLEESYQYLTEVAWFFQKLVFQFIKYGYLHNAKIVLLRLRANLFKKKFVEASFLKSSGMILHFTLPNDEPLLDLFSLLSSISYQLDATKDGFEYLSNAFELVEKIWVSEIQPARLKDPLISLTLSFCQALQLQGDFEQALRILESKASVFEKCGSEIKFSFDFLLLSLRIHCFDFDSAEQAHSLLLKSLQTQDKEKKEDQNRNTAGTEMKTLKLEILKVEILLGKGLLLEAEQALLGLIRKINRIFRENLAEQALIEKDLEFRRFYQIAIAKYYLFITDFEKALIPLKKAYAMARKRYEGPSVFVVEANSSITETLIRLLRFEEAGSVFKEAEGNELRGIGRISRRKTEALLRISEGKMVEALKIIDSCKREIFPQGIGITNADFPKNMIGLASELLFFQGKALLFSQDKDQAESKLTEALDLLETSQERNLPLKIEVLIEISKGRLKRFKTMEYLQIIRSLRGFLPEEKSDLTEMAMHIKFEVDMGRYLNNYIKDKDEENLRKSLRGLLKLKDGTLGKERKHHREQSQDMLVNRREEIQETQSFIKRACSLSQALYQSYKGNRLLAESLRLARLSEEI